MSATIQHPGCFVPLHALAFGAPATGTVAGPFRPRTRPARLVDTERGLRGSVRVLRSTDGGTTGLPLTVAGTGWANFTATRRR